MVFDFHYPQVHMKFALKHQALLEKDRKIITIIGKIIYIYIYMIHTIKFYYSEL